MDTSLELTRVRTRIRAATAMKVSPPLARPCGFSTSCLPRSLDLARRLFEEALVLQVAHPCEQATSWYMRRPPI